MNCSTCFGALSGANSKRNVPRLVLTTASSSEGSGPGWANAAPQANRRQEKRRTIRIAFILISFGRSTRVPEEVAASLARRLVWRYPNRTGVVAEAGSAPRTGVDRMRPSANGLVY